MAKHFSLLFPSPKERVLHFGLFVTWRKNFFAKYVGLFRLLVGLLSCQTQSVLQDMFFGRNVCVFIYLYICLYIYILFCYNFFKFQLAL